MYLHANAKLGLAGRLALVKAIEEGRLSLRAAAASFGVSPATAHRWWHRWLDASEEGRVTLSCLFIAPVATTVCFVKSDGHVRIVIEHSRQHSPGGKSPRGSWNDASDSFVC